MALAKKHSDVDNFFCIVVNVLNIVGASFKSRDLLREHQVEKLEELLKSGEMLTGRDELSCALQRIDQDIVNAMGVLALTKQRLQMMRNSEFESLMKDVSSFCDKHDIMIPKMDTLYFPGKSKRRALDVTYSHHLLVEHFYGVIDLHFKELNRRFNVVSTDLLHDMASLNPVNSFGNFDKNRLMRLVEYYPNEFDSIKLRDLSCQLDSFIVYARGIDKKFFERKIFANISNDAIIHRFQHMKSRRAQL
ncbi:uncharacterized protein LOC142177418 [Nicotiana tabacum]|uniref:Uncharacterized protein LOC142177418 n=1 Tax=Nicotiana tabacum TaxID=4097 RepID=A0AC58TXS2_TOBAC